MKGRGGGVARRPGSRAGLWWLEILLEQSISWTRPNSLTAVPHFQYMFHFNKYIYFINRVRVSVLIFSWLRTLVMVFVSLPVHLLAPVNVTAVEVKAWSATLQWSWSVAAYKKLEMVCQLQLFAHELNSTVSPLLNFQLPEPCLFLVRSWN